MGIIFKMVDFSSSAIAIPLIDLSKVMVKLEAKHEV
jgi:hypothetical protein